MSIKFFRKCGVNLVFFSLILALLSLTGCIEDKTQLLSASPSAEEDQQAREWSGQVRMEMDPELKSDLFSVRGDVVLAGNGTLSYLLLNATLMQGEAPPLSTEYLLMQLEPDRVYSFEIAKNVRIMPGSYICTLEATGPSGVLALEKRRCTLEAIAPDPVPHLSSISLPDKDYTGQQLSVYATRESTDQKDVSGREVKEKREEEMETFAHDLPEEELRREDEDPEETDPKGTGEAEESDDGRESAHEEPVDEEPVDEEGAGEVKEAAEAEEAIIGDMSRDLDESSKADVDLDPKYDEVVYASLSDVDTYSDLNSSNVYTHSGDPDGDGSTANRVWETDEPAGGAAGIDNGSILSFGPLEGIREEYMGSSTSKKYHLPHCRYALKIKEENRIYFQSHEDAKRQGYLPCKSCHP